MLIDKLLPILVFFAAGYGLKRGGVFVKQDGALFLRAVLYLCIPLVGFATFSRMELGIERLYPVITAFFVIIGNFLVTRLYFKKLGVEPKKYTVYILADHLDTGSAGRGAQYNTSDLGCSSRFQYSGAISL